MENDVWFARHAGSIWYSWGEQGGPPMHFPRRAESVREAMKWIRGAGIKTGQVGIADAEMLGLAE